jgi:UDP-N-acetylmuramoylalanine--D-glutamate ligase
MIENIFRQDHYCGEEYQIDRFSKFEDAVLHAKKVVSPGESVLLSPGGTSYDAFADFEERGNIFRDLVEQIA